VSATRESFFLPLVDALLGKENECRYEGVNKAMKTKRACFELENERYGRKAERARGIEIYIKKEREREVVRGT